MCNIHNLVELITKLQKHNEYYEKKSKLLTSNLFFYE